MDFLEDFFMPLIFLGGLLLALIATVAGSIHVYEYAMDRPACADYGRMSGNDVYWSFSTSCLVKQNGEWIAFNAAVKNKQEIVVKQR